MEAQPVIVMRGVKSISGITMLFMLSMEFRWQTLFWTSRRVFSGAGQTGDFVENINPDDVESISILSGPSAAALYGSAAANGVVMINTKRKVDKTDISVSHTTTSQILCFYPNFKIHTELQALAVIIAGVITCNAFYL